MSGTFPRLSGPPERSTPGDLLHRRSHSPWPAWPRNAREGGKGGWAQRLRKYCSAWVSGTPLQGLSAWRLQGLEALTFSPSAGEATFSFLAKPDFSLAHPLGSDVLILPY